MSSEASQPVVAKCGAGETDIVFIWDVDGTMISEGPMCSGEEIAKARPRARPHLEAALEFTFRHCAHVGIWTAAGREWFDHVYGTVLAPILRRLGRRFDFIWCGDRCSRSRSRPYVDIEWAYGLDTADRAIVVRKPLEKFWRSRGRRTQFGASPHNVLIVDDTPETYRHNRGNAIPIGKFTGDSDDRELLGMIEDVQRILANYNSQNASVFHRLGLPARAVGIIHSYSPIRSVRHARRFAHDVAHDVAHIPDQG